MKILYLPDNAKGAMPDWFVRLIFRSLSSLVFIEGHMRYFFCFLMNFELCHIFWTNFRLLGTSKPIQKPDGLILQRADFFSIFLDFSFFFYVEKSGKNKTRLCGARHKRPEAQRHHTLHLPTNYIHPLCMQNNVLNPRKTKEKGKQLLKSLTFKTKPYCLIKKVFTPLFCTVFRLDVLFCRKYSS